MVDRDRSLIDDYSSKMEARLGVAADLRESIFGEMFSIEECLDNYHTYKISKLYGEISFPQYLVAKESARELLQTGFDPSSATLGAGEIGGQRVSSDNNVIGHKGDFLFERSRNAGEAIKQSGEKAKRLGDLLAFSNTNKNSAAANASHSAEGGAPKPAGKFAPMPLPISVTSLLSKVQALRIIQKDGEDGDREGSDQ